VILLKNNIIIFAIIALVIGAAGGFFAGMKYQQNQRRNLSAQFGNGQFGGQLGGSNGANRFQGNGNAARNGFRPVQGEIISSDDSSITVKLPDGSSRIVLLTDKTSINKAESGSKTDLKTGETVAVFGTQNSDGSVTAQNVQLIPTLPSQ